MDQDYLQQLIDNTDWLPGPSNIFNAFTLPLTNTNAILLGESPYPRAESANGYAFWDAAVKEIWSDTGLSKKVNRATSLRHFIKMLLVADAKLTPTDTTQDAIAAIDKTNYVQTLDELFNNFLGSGILLLNASLVLSNRSVRQESKAWQPFIAQIFVELAMQKPGISLILLGNFAKSLDHLIPKNTFNRLEAEHPYNSTFIHNQDILSYFQPLQLLKIPS